jgi:SAM-dependent methyltransferase
MALIDLVNTLIKQASIRRVIDLGCGDFRVGSLIDTSSVQYIGIDIVPDLIERHNKLHSTANVRFLCLNAVQDGLPDADLCLVRQVFQHLSNEHISKILHKCKKYKYVIVSEHVPTGDNVVPNLDMDANWHIHAIQNSGVFIDRAPFTYKSEVLLELDIRPIQALEAL